MQEYHCEEQLGRIHQSHLCLIQQLVLRAFGYKVREKIVRNRYLTVLVQLQNYL